MLLVRRAAVAASMILLALPAFAHETWMMAREAVFAAPGPVPLVLSSGMQFPKPDTALPPDRLADSGALLAGKRSAIAPVGDALGALLARVDLADTGIARLWMALPPRPIELTHAQVREYFDEIQADPAVRAAWDPAAGKAWRERYGKFVATIVRVESDSATDRSWGEPIGGMLEIVPEADPTRLGADPTLTVRLLKAGEPLANLSIGAQRDGVRDWSRTDVAGRATFKLRGRGPWLIHATELKPPSDAEPDWTSWFATLTIGRQP